MFQTENGEWKNILCICEDIIDALFGLMLFHGKMLRENSKQQNLRFTAFMLHIAFLA